MTTEDRFKVFLCICFPLVSVAVSGSVFLFSSPPIVECRLDPKVSGAPDLFVHGFKYCHNIYRTPPTPHTHLAAAELTLIVTVRDFDPCILVLFG